MNNTVRHFRVEVNGKVYRVAAAWGEIREMLVRVPAQRVSNGYGATVFRTSHWRKIKRNSKTWREVVSAF